MSHYPNNERGIRHPGAGTYGESPASGPAPTTSGHHKHDILNKLDPRVDSTHDRVPAQAMIGGSNIPAGTYGPHSSRLANALDPRVDSDMDGRGHMSGAMGTGATATTAYGANPPEGTYGPHSSRLGNALDPRVDSDRDRHGAYSAQQQPATAAGYPTTTTGAGYGQPVGGAAGAGAGLGRTHHHQAQPVGYGGTNAMSGPGPAPNTAGPHRSDLMNKLDPRVDSKTGAGRERESQFSERRGI